MFYSERIPVFIESYKKNMPWHILAERFFDWKMMKFSYFCLLLAYHLLHNFKNLYTLIT